LRLASTPFWLSISLLLGIPGVALVQSAVAQEKAKSARANERTLARLRPGADFRPRVLRLLREPSLGGPSKNATWEWMDLCRDLTLKVDFDSDERVSVIRVANEKPVVADCFRHTARSLWRTGRDLAIFDPAERVIQLYGNPDSRSPSTKGGHPLELLYYAFDWAGPDVPQVMEVVCTPEQNGKPGRVVEITLAASSL
jgi:hypothetical protein